ncbi:MAG: amino acid permease [Synergistaceae bacterium]|nr:amino acid permease [Synergistaceae bacterium]
MKDNAKKITWLSLSFIAFSEVWGFGNVANGFVYFYGLQSIFSWVLIFALYFIPYALMVGELGSAFKTSGAGVSSWINNTIGHKLAYFAGWSYWACHIAYIANKGSSGLKALSWAIFCNAETYDALPSTCIQFATLAILFFFCWVASKGMNPLKKLASIAGTSTFIMSILYILLMFAAPAINPNASFIHVDFSVKNLIPNFNVSYITSLSILIFAVGGVEKISPYVNKVENPSRGFPKGIIVMTTMVIVCAVLGTLAMGMMFDPAVINSSKETFNSYVANAPYWAFQKLGQYYHVGNVLLILYALCNMIGQFAVLIISIDAPLRMLLGNEETRLYLPSGLIKQNKHGAYVNGIRLVAILSGSIILIESLVPGAANVLAQLTKLNSVCLPLRYLWVFVAYLALRKSIDKFPTEYKFTKHQTVAKFFGIWCFALTLASCLLGMYSDDKFTMFLNIATPVFLGVLGFVMPLIAKLEQKHSNNKR